MATGAVMKKLLILLAFLAPLTAFADTTLKGPITFSTGLTVVGSKVSATSGGGGINQLTGVVTAGPGVGSVATLFSTMTANAFLTGNGTGLPNQVAITGLVLGAGASAPGAYGGTSCTNQFPRSLNASGAATCASVANTDLVSPSLTVNGTTCTLGGSCSPGGGITGFDNPSATIGTAAVNGTAITAMRSDAAPAIPQASSSTFGAVKVDGTTITASGGIITAVAGGGGITQLTGDGTAGPGSGSQALTIGRTSSSIFGLSKVDNTTQTASAGVTSTASTTINGTTCTPGGSCTPQGAVTPLTTGTSVSLSAPRGYFVCTGTCTITLPVPAAGDEFCVRNDNNVATVITFAALGSGAMYEKTTFLTYGTAGTGTAVSSGVAGDKLCVVGRDSTHYLVGSYLGTWTMN
jgi:hypothetical protein